MMPAHDAHNAHVLELTPLMVDGTLYGCTPHSAIFALDPTTGQQIWRHETKDPTFPPAAALVPEASPS